MTAMNNSKRIQGNYTPLFWQLLLIALLTLCTTTAHAQQYTYDANNRLTKVVYDSGMTVEYGYDVMGNRTSKTVTIVKRVVIGDANGDGMVDVADVVAIVNKILDKASDSFVFEAADVNNDSVIDVSDVVGVVNIILKGGTQNSPEARSRARAYLRAHGFIVCD
jgi:YD repeat-containing protein